MKRLLGSLIVVLFLTGFSGSAAAAERLNRYILILAEEPLAVQAGSSKDLRNAAAADARRRIEAAQGGLRAALKERKIVVTGSTQTLLNAVFVAAPASEAGRLANLPGVARVEPDRPVKRHMNRAIDLVRAQQAWPSVGGEQGAGAGVKIAILDSGIDQDHPAFQDPSLPAMAGYPKCAQDRGECAFTNNKVIAARSYVDELVLGEDPQFSRPDDLSPRDRVGHGTAIAMVAAGVRNQGPAATIVGVAPKAYLGNYKIFGSPGVNDTTFLSVVIRALEDAADDGMEIVSLSVGFPAVWGANDRGATCGNAASEACDAWADAVANAVSRRGITIVASAGNDGDLGLKLPALGSIHSPATALPVITVGATTNAHVLYSTLSVTGDDVPGELRNVSTLFGNGPRPAAPITAPMRDVARLQDNGKACASLGRDALAGAVALIERGDCDFGTKINHAANAGAVAAVIYQFEGSNQVFPMANLQETAIPATLIGNTSGKALKSFLETHADRPVTLDPALVEFDDSGNADIMAYFSSYGPSIGDGAIKPEIVAPGMDMYMATQKYDPNGEMYSASGYISGQGTSFAAPVVAGAAALIKQRNRNLTPALIKSAIVNTATPEVDDFDDEGRFFAARVTAAGAGKLDLANAIRANVAVEPATLSFGIVGTTLPGQSLRIVNTGGDTLNLQLRVQPRGTDPGQIRLSESSFSLAPGASRTITATLTATPGAGAHEGIVSVEGGAVPLRVPYLYLRGDGIPDNVLPLTGYDFTGEVNQFLASELTVKVIDQFGVPVQGVPVRFRSTAGGGGIDVQYGDGPGNDQTDRLGITAASVYLGPELGEQEFSAEAGTSNPLRIYFPGRARLTPTIAAGGILNAASGLPGQGLAPGSYISIYGAGLSETTKAFNTPWLPLSLAGVSVSFDIPQQNLSLPGRLHFVSPGQVNVQIPWELQGRNGALMKVSIGLSSSAVFIVPLNDYAPAFFEYTEGSSGRLLAAALDGNNNLVGTGNPVERGAVVQLYANGLGPVNNGPPTGEASPVQPLAETRVTPSVTVGGRPAAVQFSGLAPYFVGLYQVNAVVPQDSPTGIQPLVITVNGVESKAASLPVR